MNEDRCEKCLRQVENIFSQCALYLNECSSLKTQTSYDMDFVLILNK